VVTARGKLICPLVVELARIDTAGTKTAGKYDPTFRTLKPGTSRTELAPIKLHAQVEQGTHEQQNQTQAGNVPDTRVTCVFHFRELEALGLVDAATGDALIRVGDRLVAIYDRTGAIKDGSYKPANGAAYATKVEPGGLGLGGRRNLLIVVFEDRPQGLTSNP
jgi:hypothetical protein